MGIPKPEQAYNEAKREAYKWSHNRRFSHDCVRIAFWATGVSELQSPTQETKELFFLHYEMATKKFDEKIDAHIASLKEILN